MADNAQKTPPGLSLNRFARAKAADQIAQTGKSLPCQVVSVKGSIVQVAFQVTSPPGWPPVSLPNVTIPVAGSEYIRYPIQVGCKGVAQAADAYLGGMSGIGGGVATLTSPGNLTALVFQPIGNNGWFAVDGNILTLYGPGGVTLMDQGQTTFLKLAPGKITFSAGGRELVISSAGIIMDGIVFGTHVHAQGADSNGDVEVPTSGPANP